MIDDVGSLIDSQRKSADLKREAGSLNDSYFEYLFYNELDQWMHYITKKYSKFSSLEELGQSTEGGFPFCKRSSLILNF